MEITATQYEKAVLNSIRPITEADRIRYATSFFEKLGIRLGRIMKRERIEKGDHWPINAITMIGMKRLTSLRDSIIENSGKGDFIEAGVWRGGALVWMAALAHCYSPNSKVIGFDTFDGFKEKDSHDPKDNLDTFEYLRVSERQVRANIESYGLNATLVSGDCRITMPKYQFGNIAVLRVDVDRYGPMQAVLDSCFPHLIHGAHVHLDDLGLKSFRNGWKDWCRKRRLSSEVKMIDWTGGIWIKP